MSVKSKETRIEWYINHNKSSNHHYILPHVHCAYFIARDGAVPEGRGNMGTGLGSKG